jgi:hypothetical protein
MLLLQVEKVIESVPKGANIVLQWVRKAKTKKGSPKILKAVRMVGRVGIEYDNQKAVQEKRSNGELPKENAGLAEWAEWVEYPFLIQHKGNGQKYLRLYKGTSKKVTPSVQWICEGKAVEQKDISQWLYADEMKSSHGDCFIVKIEDLTTIGSENEDYGAIFQA